MDTQEENMRGGTQVDEYAGFLGYEVEDRNGDKIGTVKSLWEDHTGQPAFLGISTGWLGLGRIHIVPAYFAEYAEKGRRIRLPFRSEVIKSAPELDSDKELSESEEADLYDYYRSHGIDVDEDTASAGARASAENTTESDAERPAESSGTTRIPLREETLQVGKREVEAGGVRLRKVIRTEIVNQPVELRHEELEIERVPARAGSDTADAGQIQEEEIFIPLRKEAVDVSKSTRVREEARISKKSASESSNVRETVRKEDLEVDRENDPSR